MVYSITYRFQRIFKSLCCVLIYILLNNPNFIRIKVEEWDAHWEAVCRLHNGKQKRKKTFVREMYLGVYAYIYLAQLNGLDPAAAPFSELHSPQQDSFPSRLNQDRAVVSHVEGTGSVLAPPDWIKLNSQKIHIQARFKSTLRWRAVLYWFLPVPNHITLLLPANLIPLQAVHNSVHNYGDTKLQCILPKKLD